MHDRRTFLMQLGVPRRAADGIARNHHTAGRMEFRDEGDQSELLIYESIGYDWWTDSGMTASRFADELSQRAGVKKLTVRLNSPGGDVWDGMAIYNQLAAFTPRVEVSIDGLAASIASLIAMAGDVINASEVSQIMIHDAWTYLAGNEQDMRDVADILAKIDGQMAETYAVRAGSTAAEFSKLMDAETYFTAAEAMEIGLIDGVTNERKQGDQAANRASGVARNRQKRQIRLTKARIGI